MLNNFIKSYSDRTYKYTTLVRHKGALIAFAMDDRRRIAYTLLDLQPSPQTSAEAANARSPFDKDAWSPSPQELIFANEIAEAGFGVADQTILPVYKKDSAMPEAAGAILPAPEKPEASTFDYFLSTTARLSADAPIQALSDGQYLYLFRQAIARTDAAMVFKRDKDGGGEIKDKAGQRVPLVDGTLLVDRFMLVGGQLKPKMEVRYQRSRSKTRPQSRKDSLGAKDLDGNFFYEPTQELKFVGHLTGGRFAALLIPTQVAEVQRWQIFAQNSRTGLMDSFNVERAADGLFNTRGSQTYACVDHPEVYAGREGQCVEPSLSDSSQTCGKPLIPRISTAGYAESALKFEKPGARVELKPGVSLGPTFTVETWIYPTRSKSTTPVVLMGSGSLDSTASPTLRIEAQSKLCFGFGDGTDWHEVKSKNILTPNEWNHLAVSFDGRACRFYLNGRLRDKSEALNGTMPASTPVSYFGGTDNAFNGVLDEIRLWKRGRSASELRADMHQRLTGLEPGLAGYWRFDEADGDTVYDQTVNDANGRISDAEWTPSDAPVGEHSGVNRSSFRIAGRDFASGPTALLYYQQAEAAGGYAGKRKPLKQTGRVMLAVATNDGSTANADKNQIAALDLGVSPTGRLAQVPDSLSLRPISPQTTVNNLTLNEQLDQMSGWQAQVRLLSEDIARLTSEMKHTEPVLTLLNTALANPTSITANITEQEFSHLNEKLTNLKQAYQKKAVADKAWQDLDVASRNAKVTVFEHHTPEFSGDSLPFSRGFVDLAGHKFNNQISSIKIEYPLQVIAYAEPNHEGHKTVLTKDVPDLRSVETSNITIGTFQLPIVEDWNDKISSMDIGVDPKLSDPIVSDAQTTANSLTSARNEVTTARDVLQTRIQPLVDEKKAKTDLKNAAEDQMAGLDSLVSRGSSATMPRVHIDPSGLTISGGVLSFAWTKDAPLLFDSAAGSLALYFRGGDDQFFVAYYDTLTEPARYPLAGQDTGQPQPCVTCLARSTDEEMSKLSLEVSGGAEDDPCTVTITSAGLTETWSKVPRDPRQFAKVLNGLAGERTYIGSGQIVAGGAASGELSMPDGVRRVLAKGATLMVGSTRVTARAQVFAGDIRLPIATEALHFSSEKLPVFFIEYDYAANAATTQKPADLSNGSLMVWAIASDQAGQRVRDQQIKGGSTLVCKWTADAPGSTLAFDGVSQYAGLAEAGKLKQFDAAGDLTLEAWVRPSRVKDKARVIQHRSANSGYMLALEKRELTSALEFDGAQNYVAINMDSSLTGTFTVEAWVKPNAPTAVIGVVGSRTPSADYGFDFKFQGGNKIHGDIGDDQGWLTTQADVPFTYAVGFWYHVAYVVTPKGYTIYVNGVAIGSGKYDGLPLLWDKSHPLRIGETGAGGEYMQGAIDEVRIWKKARTQIDIEADMFRRLGGKETDLVGYWHFDGGAANDYSRYRNNGTIVGPPRKPIVSPVPAYTVVAGVGEQFVQARQIIPAGNWTHLAAAFDQAYGLEFDGSGDSLDCGNDATLDLSHDLTLEVFLQIAPDNRARYLLRRGAFDDGDADQQAPYALWINESNNWCLPSKM